MGADAVFVTRFEIRFVNAMRVVLLRCSIEQNIAKAGIPYYIRTNGRMNRKIKNSGKGNGFFFVGNNVKQKN